MTNAMDMVCTSGQMELSMKVNSCMGKSMRKERKYFADKWGVTTENGDWVKADGYGSRMFANGDHHEGIYKAGKQHGFGTYRWENGDYFEEEWFEGKICGSGLKRMANNDSFEGEWFDGMAHGSGMKVFHRGDIYIGNFQHGEHNGRGVYKYSNGDEFDGIGKMGDKRVQEFIISLFLELLLKDNGKMDKFMALGIIRYRVRSSWNIETKARVLHDFIWDNEFSCKCVGLCSMNAKSSNIIKIARTSPSIEGSFMETEIDYCTKNNTGFAKTNEDMTKIINSASGKEWKQFLDTT
eukprot:CAMPEP_0194199684 /NCGR_PEP_ID=MMETSP0156-20130528/609_1 /TAXON_ID=33649 /ORGANISM="Thalassionema nitzschioides, Strain L26-B" /LENGTH=294 /DNA_ID=CAMNT_0038924619 /DNA_START=743 /DNA_END=1627 /DNA_ORIENTATION=-